MRTGSAFLLGRKRFVPLYFVRPALYAESSSHPPPEDRQARLSGTGRGYLRASREILGTPFGVLFAFRGARNQASLYRHGDCRGWRPRQPVRLHAFLRVVEGADPYGRTQGVRIFAAGEIPKKIIT